MKNLRGLGLQTQIFEILRESRVAAWSRLFAHTQKPILGASILGFSCALI